MDAASEQTCCGGRDMVRVEHERDADGATLLLPLGQGPNVMRILRDAVEENQETNRLDALVGSA